jgi:hypothetical protein
MWIKHQPPPRSRTPKIEYYSVPSGMYDCIQTEQVSLVDPKPTTPMLPNSATTRTTTTPTRTRASTKASTTKAINVPSTTTSTTTALESQERNDNDIQYRRPDNTTTTTKTVLPEGVKIMAITPQPTTNQDIDITSSVFFNEDDDDFSWTWSEDLHLDHQNRPSNERLLVRCLLCFMFKDGLFLLLCFTHSVVLFSPTLPYTL